MRRAVVRGVRLLVLPTVVVLGVAVFASGRLGPGGNVNLSNSVASPGRTKTGLMLSVASTFVD